MPDPVMSSPGFSLYIVRCANGSLYTGIATDVQKRLGEHETSPRGSRYLRGKGPLEVVFAEVVGDRARASRLEHRVKRLSRRQKLELIDGRRQLAALADDQVLGEGLA